MSGSNEDDKPTVILDLNALKKQKLKQEEDLANIASELEFNVGKASSSAKTDKSPPPLPSANTVDFLDESESSLFLENFMEERQKTSDTLKGDFPVILFDFQSDFFSQSTTSLPKGFSYRYVSSLGELNQCLKVKSFQIVVFNYDVNPKAINQLSAQVKQKFPFTKTLIMARSISAEKAQLHAQGPSGANGYYQLPIDAMKVEKELLRISSEGKKGS